jgi:hypothetical protein
LRPLCERIKDGKTGKRIKFFLKEKKEENLKKKREAMIFEE